jgi:O-antigen ligase
MFIVWTFVRRWQGREITFVKYRALGEVLLVVMTLWLLKGPSQKAASATALAALASGLAVFAVLLWTKKSRIKLGMILFPTIIVFIIGFGIVTMIAGGSTVASFTSAFGRDDTLTGRSDIWAVLVPVFEHKPLLGSGFGSFWTSQTRDLYEMGEAHSGYLDVLLELGFVGIVLITIFLVSTCIKALKELNYDFDWASLFISYLIMALVHNISESSFNSFTNQLTAALLFMAVSLTLSAPLAPGVPTKRRRDIAECCG